jgi:hypothetical protein
VPLVEIALPDGPPELQRPARGSSAEQRSPASRTRTGSSTRLLVVIATIAGALAVALGVTAFALSVGTEPETDVSLTPAAGARTAIAILSKPGAEHVPFAGSGKRLELVVGSLGRGALVLDGLPAVPADRIYQAWHRVGGESASLALFEGGEVAVPLAGLLPPGATITVTLEPSGGSQAPTGKVLYTATRRI